MVALINVFYRGTEDEDRFIATFVKYGVIHFVDSVRFKDQNWMAENCKNGKLYRCIYEDMSISYESAPYEVSGPGVFVLIVQTDEAVLEEVKDYYDYAVWDFLESCQCDHSDGIEIFMQENGMTVQKIEDNVVPVDKGKRKANQEDYELVGYTFEMTQIEDTTFYQLTKPNVDRPYVVETKEFSKHGHKRLFSSMRLFESWGVSAHDTEFLVQVYKHLGFTDIPDFDAILKEHSDACLSGEEEPNIWRCPLTEVTDRFISKRHSSQA